MKGEKVIHRGEPGGNGRPVLISSWKCNFGIYLDIQVYYLDIQTITTLLCLILILCVLLPSIHSIFYVITALLKSDVFHAALKIDLLAEFYTYKDQTRFVLKRNEVSIENYP